MCRLGTKDYERVAKVARELYAQTDLARFPDTVLAGLARLIPSDSLSYDDIDPRTDALVMVLRPHLEVAFQLAPLLQAHILEHPLLNFYRSHADRGVHQLSDFASAREFQKTGLYQEFYGRLEVDHQVAVPLSGPGETMDVGITINRKHREFSQRDRAVLMVLQPHLIQARANALAFAAAQQRAGALADSLGWLNANVLLLRPDGQLAWSSPRAMKLLAQFFPGAAGRAGQLPEPLACWWRKRLALAQSAAPLAETQRPFIKILPGARLTAHAQTGPDGAHRLLLTEEKVVSLAERGGQWGLTVRELEVLHWLAEGKNNPEIAVILRISPRTVHKHVEHIFRKLGVETRHAAMRKALDWKGL